MPATYTIILLFLTIHQRSSCHVNICTMQKEKINMKDLMSLCKARNGSFAQHPDPPATSTGFRVKTQ